MRLVPIAALALVLVTTAACGSTAKPVAAPATSSAADVATQLVCSTEAGQDISAAVGIAPSQPVKAVWQAPVYSCRYVYPAGAMTLSVQEYPGTTAIDAGYAKAKASGAPTTDLPAIGDAAFTRPDGSVVVRKDAKMLTVDVSGLPARFGQPERSRAGIAQIVAVVIMDCWTGG